jgi:very-short-patch-repair endonuclease
MSNTNDWNDTDFHLSYNRQLVEKAKELRKNMTPAEKKLWYGYLRMFKFRILRQRPINNFIVNLFCAQLRLLIEVDGESHFTDEGKDYDWERTQILEGYGLKVLRFSNDEVLQDWEGVCRRIEEEIPPTPLKKQGCFIPQKTYTVKG